MNYELRLRMMTTARAVEGCTDPVLLEDAEQRVIVLSDGIDRVIYLSNWVRATEDL
jgi:hypothetical protein